MWHDGTIFSSNKNFWFGKTKKIEEPQKLKSTLKTHMCDSRVELRNHCDNPLNSFIQKTRSHIWDTAFIIINVFKFILISIGTVSFFPADSYFGHDYRSMSIVIYLSVVVSVRFCRHISLLNNFFASFSFIGSTTVQHVAT